MQSELGHLFSCWLRYQRHKLGGISQSDFSRKLDVGHASLLSWEFKGSIPRCPTLVKITNRVGFLIPFEDWIEDIGDTHIRIPKSVREYLRGDRGSKEMLPDDWKGTTCRTTGLNTYPNLHQAPVWIDR